MDTSAHQIRNGTSSSNTKFYDADSNSSSPNFDIRQKVVNRIYQYLEIPASTTQKSSTSRTTDSRSSTEDDQDSDSNPDPDPDSQQQNPRFIASSVTYSCLASSTSLTLPSWSSSLETQTFTSWPTPPPSVQPLLPLPQPPLLLQPSVPLPLQSQMKFPLTRIQSYATAKPCEHVNHRKRLRVKKGYIYYVCLCCGAKWRIPAHRRAQTKELQQAVKQAKLDELMRNLEI